MTTRRNKKQAIQPSDYDSEPYQTPSTSAPRPSTRTNAQLNLSVLRRHDPHVHSILSIAPYAVVYGFSPLTSQWEKSGIEGTLFVCRLSTQPLTLYQEPTADTDPDGGVERYTVMVLNRRGLQNFTVELLSAADVEVTEEYVILQVAEEENKQEAPPSIYGLWIFSEPAPSSTANTRAINAQIIQDCAAQAEVSRTRVAAKERERERERGQVVVVQATAQATVQVTAQATGAQEEPTVGKQGTTTTTTVGEGGPVESSSVPMGRQVSLRELFGQQREQDSGWSVKQHNGGPQDPSGQFSMSADTEFFRSTVRPSQQHKVPKGKVPDG
ncbi:MAG: mRNA-decapping enzyme 1B [Peltula sp. TS41687]|nr:MAG: mRNA-decapping enzyme 1B [Peltula sp. TS41687]